MNNLRQLQKIFLNYRPLIHPTPSELETVGVALGVVAKNIDHKFPQVTLMISQLWEPLVYKSQFIL